jgi:hypothetical protein
MNGPETRPMPAIRCTRCDAITFADRDGAACERCGEKLPAPDAIGTEPAEERPAGVRSGRPLEDIPPYLDVRKREDVREERRKKAASEVSGMLIAIALLTVVCNAINFYLRGAPPPGNALPLAVLMILGVVVVYVGLGIWARWMPIPAGIIGLVLYLGLAGLEVALSASAGAPGLPRGLILKVFITLGLVRCVYAAIKAG